MARSERRLPFTWRWTTGQSGGTRSTSVALFIESGDQTAEFDLVSGEPMGVENCVASYKAFIMLVVLVLINIRNSFSHRFRARLRYKWHGIGAWDSAETQAASLPHHLHRRAARGTRASLFPHPIPGRLHPGRAGSDHGPHRSPYPGMVLQPQGTPSQALWRFKLRAFAHEQWKL